MAVLVADCPRCDAQRITFDLLAATHCGNQTKIPASAEFFGVCRHCRHSTIFSTRVTQQGLSFGVLSGTQALAQYAGAINQFCETPRYVSLKDYVRDRPPEHLPENISAASREAATCLAVSCYNAAGTMFRLCVDLATKPLLPPLPTDGSNPTPNRRTRRDLGLRLTWLFNEGLLPTALQPLAKCIREDANDGAHAGTLEEVDAQDLRDFTFALLERLITEPEKIKLAEKRRDDRRNPPQS